MKMYSVYSVKNLLNGKEYIGITSRNVLKRIKCHVDDALCRIRGKSMSLQSAIRDAYNDGCIFDRRFSVTILHKNKSKEQAGRLEDDLIQERNTMFPSGYNIIKGGGSYGSPANAKEISFEHRGCRYHFESIQAAVAFVKKKFGIEIKYWTVTNRLRSGHPPEAALGLSDFEDKRKLRNEFYYQGEVNQCTSEVANDLGLSHAAVRSRQYRNRNKSEYDVAVRAKPKSYGNVLVPNPEEPDGELVSGVEFIKITGGPASTFYTRLRQLIENGTYEEMSRHELVEHLSRERTDRRKIISLKLPTGAVLTGGVNELGQLVLDSPELKVLQIEEVNSISTIKARLRRTNYQEIEWAFGFENRLSTNQDSQKPIKGRRNNPLYKDAPFFSISRLELIS